MTAVLTAAAFAVILLLFLIFPAMRRHPDRKILKGLCIAHRGLHNISAGVPENSVSAFRLARELGFAVENDIHLTADGEIVVFHDSDTLRMCGVVGTVEQMTLSQLKELRLAGTDEQIPTLSECLDEIDGKVPILIEFKAQSNTELLCSAADAVLREYKGKYFIQSFYPPVVAWYRKNRPDICRGQLSDVFGKKDPPYYKVLSCLLTNVIARPDFISYNFKHRGFFFRKLCTALGAMPIGWTFKSEREQKIFGSDFEAFIFENYVPSRVTENDEKQNS